MKTHHLCWLDPIELYFSLLNPIKSQFLLVKPITYHVVGKFFLETGLHVFFSILSEVRDQLGQEVPDGSLGEQVEPKSRYITSKNGDVMDPHGI